MTLARTTLILLLVSTGLTAVSSAETTTVPTKDNDIAVEPTPKSIASDLLGAMDRTVDPCQDFYRFACGNWNDTTQLPADQSRWIRSASVLRERNRSIVRDIIEQAAADPDGSAVGRKIGTYYGACMDTAAIDEAGTEPLGAYLRRVETAKDAASLMRVTGELHRIAIPVFFDFQTNADFKEPDLNVALMMQGGLGLPDRDYYLSDDAGKQQIRAEYRRHVARMLVLAGEDSEAAERSADQVIAIETELARASRERAQMRDYAALHNRLDIDGLKKLTPELPWPAYLEAIGYPGVTKINVATPEFFEALKRTVTGTPMAQLRSYLRWHVIRGNAALLPEAFVTAHFDFYGGTLRGQEQIEPRWKRCVDDTQDALGEAVGRIYVQQMFPGDSRQIAMEMIDDLEAAFAYNLASVAWMDETTRKRARGKLEALSRKIGYPDTWRDYSSLELDPKSYVACADAAAEFHFDIEARKIGKPVNRDEWYMPPQTVNAYHNPTANEIVFPAGILQPPFFYRNYPAAMNYGSIGGVIGHELTHGYDDQGRKFDPTGRLAEWWEPDVGERFNDRAQCVAASYSEYEVEGGLYINGRLTLGENIADLGGLKMAYQAYKLWEKRHGAPQPAIDGLSSDQLLFVAWAQNWCAVMAPEVVRMQVATARHSPPRFRVIGPMSNTAAFAEAFSCEPGTPMNPTKKCEVW